MSNPRDRHIQHQHRASANTYAIATSDTQIPVHHECNWRGDAQKPHTSTTTPDGLDPPRKATATHQKVTLDSLYKTKISTLQTDRQRTRVLKKKVRAWHREWSELRALPLSELSDAQLHRMFALEEDLRRAKAEINSTCRGHDATDYFMATGDILFEYYENIKSISSGSDRRRKRPVALAAPEEPSVDEDEGGRTKESSGDLDRRGGTVETSHSAGSATALSHTTHIPQKSKSVIDFLLHKPRLRTRVPMADEDSADQESPAPPDTDSTEAPVGGTVAPLSPQAQPQAHPQPQPQPQPHTPNASPRPQQYLSRQVLLQQYLQRTDASYVHHSEPVGDLSDIDMCPDCGRERVLIHHEAMLLCPNPACARSDTILVDSHRPSYKDSAREGTSYYSYKRINHFNEWLAQFQAKETTDIPEDVYHNIYVELKKERISNMARITPAKMKEILKRLKLNKYYEHIPHIINRINGQPAPVMNRATEEKLRSMFKEIQGPFLKHCPPERKNFLSYSYVLHKFCQLLGLDHFLPCFPLLKSREKLHLQDVIWEKICGELRWEFIKSV